MRTRELPHKPLPSYPFRMLSLVFWILVIVLLKTNNLGNGLSWLGCILCIFILWVLTIAARGYGVQILPILFKEVALGFIKQLPFLLPAVLIGMAIIVIGYRIESSVLMWVGAIFEFLTIWIIDWPQKEWYKAFKKNRK